MGIISTQYITREEAIDRLHTVDRLRENENYQTLAGSTNESSYSLRSFVLSWQASKMLTYDKLNKWTNDMLEDKMDEPFYRQSMFENYVIIGEDDD